LVHLSVVDLAAIAKEESLPIFRSAEKLLWVSLKQSRRLEQDGAINN
jgi:hypothetical protein